MKKLRKQMSAKRRLECDLLIAKRVCAVPEFAKAATIACYLSVVDEVGTDSIILDAFAQGKRVVAPRVRLGTQEMDMCQLSALTETSRGQWGLREPLGMEVAPDHLELILAPGLAFSADGTRLGMGGGFYDRYLAHCPQHVLRIGLAYDCQVLENLPHDAHDQRMNLIVTETRVMIC